jgi:hypothetical protein
MKAKWIGIAIVLAIVVGIFVAKARWGKSQNSSQASNKPQVVLVATPAEAVSITRCGEIVQTVRTAAQHGVRVQELTPDSKSELVARYHIFQTPTVLVFDANGEVRSRFVGEAPETLAALQLEMGRMSQ